MDDLNDVVLALFGVAIAAVMLIAGELYLITRPIAKDFALGTERPRAASERSHLETIND